MVSNEMLSATSVEALLAGNLRSLGQESNLREFIQDVAAALRTKERELKQLQEGISRMGADRRVTQGPMATAVKALNEMSAGEQRQVLDVWAQGMVARLNDQAATTRMHSMAAVSAVARTKHALGLVLEHPECTVALAQVVAEAVASIPPIALAGEVEVNIKERADIGFVVPTKDEEVLEASVITQLFEDEQSNTYPPVEEQPLASAPQVVAHPEGPPTFAEPASNGLDDLFESQPVAPANGLDDLFESQPVAPASAHVTPEISPTLAEPTSNGLDDLFESHNETGQVKEDTELPREPSAEVGPVTKTTSSVDTPKQPASASQIRRAKLLLAAQNLQDSYTEVPSETSKPAETPDVVPTSPGQSAEPKSDTKLSLDDLLP